MDSRLTGTWLNISGLRSFHDLDLIEFSKNRIHYFRVENQEASLRLQKKRADIGSENLLKLSFEFINPERIRFFRKGQQHTVLSDTESKTEEKIFKQDYVKLIPTISTISEEEIQQSKYKLNWNNEKLIIEFNKDLDPPEFVKLLKERGEFGREIRLEKIDDTLLITMIFNRIRDWVLPIKEIDNTELKLYGLPEKPYETISKKITNLQT